MIPTIIMKELRAVLLSPRFAATFLVCSVLIILSFTIGIKEYRAAVAQTEASNRLVDQEARGRTSWGGFSTRISRIPDPLQVVISGVTNDIGRLSTIGEYSPVKLSNSLYEDETVYAVFRMFDLSTIVQIVLALFAILFTYDAINGENEGATLQLTFSHPVPRVSYLAGKFLGALAGLTIPLTVPVLIGILLLQIEHVPMSGTDWTRLLLFLGIAFLYFTFFVALGLLASLLTRRTSVSFLAGLVAWVVLTLIVPRIAIATAGQIVPVPSEAEVDGQRDTYSKDRWDTHMKSLQERWRARMAGSSAMTESQQQAYRDAHRDEWQKADDSLRAGVEKDIDRYSERLASETGNRRMEQERLAVLMSRCSPAATLQLAAMNIAGTDIGLKSRTEEALRAYRDRFVPYVKQKQKETGQRGGLSVQFDSQRGLVVDAGKPGGSLDYSDLPRFDVPERSLAGFALPVAADAGVLLFLTCVVLAISFVRFQRYDIH